MKQDKQENNDEEKFVERVINGGTYYWHPEFGWCAKSFDDFFGNGSRLIGCNIEEPNIETHPQRRNIKMSEQEKLELDAVCC